MWKMGNTGYTLREPIDNILTKSNRIFINGEIQELTEEYKQDILNMTEKCRMML